MEEQDRIELINNIPLHDIKGRTTFEQLMALFLGLADRYHEHDEYITKVEAVDIYATKVYIDTKVNKKETDIDNIDLSLYITKLELENKKYLTKIPDEYVTLEEINKMGFITEEQDLSAFAKKDYTNSKIAELKQYVIDKPFALKTYVAEIDAMVDELEVDVADLKVKFADLRTDIDELKKNQGIVTPPTPDEPEPEPVYYTITYDLSSNMSLSNKATTIIENSQYETTLNVYPGYKADFVQVYMGDTNITGSAYQEHLDRIFISKVTGNISIKITTVEDEIGCPDISSHGYTSGAGSNLECYVQMNISVPGLGTASSITCTIEWRPGMVTGTYYDGGTQSAYNVIGGTSFLFHLGQCPNNGAGFNYKYTITYVYDSGESGTVSGAMIAG